MSSGSINLNLDIKPTGSSARRYFHTSGSVLAYLDYNVTRNGSTLKWRFSWSSTKNNYGYTLSIDISVDGVTRNCTLISTGTITNGSVEFDTTNTNTNGTATVAVTGHCNSPAYGDSCDEISRGEDHGWRNGVRDTIYQNVEVPKYVNPWSNPTQAIVRTDLIGSIKPESSIEVRWSKAFSGSGNTVNHYSVCVQRYRNNKWSDRITVGDNIGIDTTSAWYTPGKFINLRSGDKIRFDVNTYITPVRQGGSAGWSQEVYGFNYSNEISIYKDGCIYYKNSGNEKLEPVMAYYKNSNGEKSKLRYVLVKDSSGAQRVIDVYTTNYE